MKYFVLALLLLGTISVQAQSELPGLNSLDSGWNTIATDGVCSTGTAYQFFAKPSADNSNLLIPEMMKLTQLTDVKQVMCDMHKKQDANMPTNCDCCFEEDIVKLK